METANLQVCFDGRVVLYGFEYAQVLPPEPQSTALKEYPSIPAHYLPPLDGQYSFDVGLTADVLMKFTCSLVGCLAVWNSATGNLFWIPLRDGRQTAVQCLYGGSDLYPGTFMNW